MEPKYLFAVALVSGLLCALVVPFVRALAVAFDVVDYPGERRIHTKPMPRLGGVAIFFSFIATLSGAWLVAQKLPDAHRVNPTGVWGFAIAGTVVFLAGVIDDVVTLRPRSKLLFELAGALIVTAWGGCRVRLLSVPGGSIELGDTVAFATTVAWIIAVTNAVNLLDGLDGLAAGVAAIAFATIGVTAASEHGSVAIVAAIFVGSSLGFLAHNFAPATIFMGDSGSLFLGFSLGVLSTYSGAKATTGAITFAPILILALPLADTVFAMLRRYASGLVPSSLRSHLAGVSRMFVPDRLHVHHRLLRAGFGPRAAVYILYALQALACAVAIYVAVVRVSGRGNG